MYDSDLYFSNIDSGMAGRARLGRTQEDLNKYKQRIDTNAENQKGYAESIAEMHNKVTWRELGFYSIFHDVDSCSNIAGILPILNEKWVQYSVPSIRIHHFFPWAIPAFLGTQQQIGAREMEGMPITIMIAFWCGWTKNGNGISLGYIEYRI